MRPKYKVTGCFRFILFFIIFVPIVYFGAAYIRGEDGVQMIKDYYHQVIGKSEAKPESQNAYNPADRINVLERDLAAANQKIRELETKLKEKEDEIRKLKNK